MRIAIAHPLDLPWVWPVPNMLLGAYPPDVDISYYDSETGAFIDADILYSQQDFEYRWRKWKNKLL